MTMVKTVGVSSERHLRNVCSYLNDERVIAREGWNLGDTRPGRWEREMALTREAYGHHVPAKAGAKNTVLYHQILAFNADDCRLNDKTDGLSGMDCMNYAREWCAREYPNQEVLLVLHKEHCTADNTDRWAVHLAVNRSDLESGKRYHAGPGHVASAHRAKLAREMDRKWGLKETVRGARNSEIHRRQPSRPVKEMRKRGERTAFDSVQQAALRSLEPTSMRSLVQFKTVLARHGVALAQRGSDLYYKFERYIFKGETVGVSRADVMALFAQREQAARKAHAASERSRVMEFVARLFRGREYEPVSDVAERPVVEEPRCEAKPIQEQLPLDIGVGGVISLEQPGADDAREAELNKTGITKKYAEARAAEQQTREQQPQRDEKPERHEPAESSGERELNQAAKEWARAWRRYEYALEEDDPFKLIEAKTHLRKAERGFADMAYEHEVELQRIYTYAERVAEYCAPDESVDRIMERIEQREYSDDVLDRVSGEHGEPEHISYEDQMRGIEGMRGDVDAAIKEARAAAERSNAECSGRNGRPNHSRGGYGVDD